MNHIYFYFFKNFTRKLRAGEMDTCDEHRHEISFALRTKFSLFFVWRINFLIALWRNFLSSIAQYLSRPPKLNDIAFCRDSRSISRDLNKQTGCGKNKSESRCTWNVCKTYSRLYHIKFLRFLPASSTWDMKSNLFFSSIHSFSLAHTYCMFAAISRL